MKEKCAFISMCAFEQSEKGMKFNMSKHLKFKDLIAKLSSHKVISTNDGYIIIDGTNISCKEFNYTYMPDITSFLSEFESTFSPEFTPGENFYATLDALSSPALKDTDVPEELKDFYKNMNNAISKNDENRNSFESSITEYIEKNDAPVFMLATLHTTIKDNNNGTKDTTSLFQDNENRTEDTTSLIQDNENKAEDTISSFSETIMPSSQNLMDGYGTMYSGNDILFLADTGFINSKQPINMIEKNPSLYVQDENADNYIQPVTYTELLKFYSPENHPGRIYQLVQKGNTDANFVTSYTKLLESVSPQDRETFYNSLIKEANELAQNKTYMPEKDNDTISMRDNFSEILLNYANARIIPDRLLLGKISPRFLIDKFNNGQIPLNRIIDIYESAPDYFKQLLSIITISTLEEAKYESAKNPNNNFQDTELRALSHMPSKAVNTYLTDDNTELRTVMYVYLHYDKITINELQNLLSKQNIIESLDSYIDEGSSPAKIKELYENYLIDYGCIKNLINSGVLKDKDLQKYKLGIPKDEVYDSIQSASEIIVSSASPIVPSYTTGAFIGPQPTANKTTEKTKNLYRILGNIGEDTSINIPTISQRNERNSKGFLDGYKVLPLKPAGLVTLVPQEDAKKTYIMPYQEFAYILHKKDLPESFLENVAIQEVLDDEKKPENILKIALQFDEAREYLEKLGYLEALRFEEAIKIMSETYNRIKIKGDN